VPPSPKFEFLYAVSFVLPAGTTSISSFTVASSTGALQSTSTTDNPSFVLGVDATPSAKFLYASEVDLVGGGLIEIFSLSASSGAPKSVGAFFPNTICAFCPPHSGPGSLAMAPGGKTLYYGSSTIGVVQGIGALAVNPADGSLSIVPGSPFAADDVPAAVLVHPSGRFLYTVNVANLVGTPLVTSLSCFSIDSVTGALSPVPGSPFPVGGSNGYTGAGIDPTGKFLFMSTGAPGGGILGWSIDSASGALTAVPNTPVVQGSTTVNVAFSKTGKFVYSSGGLGGGIHAFVLDQASGNLTPLSGSPFFSGSTLSSLVTDPTGTWLFAVAEEQKSVVAFRLDMTTGSITSSGSPAPTPVKTPVSHLIIRSTP